MWLQHQYALQHNLHFKVLLSHISHIFVCWRSIACTFTGDCLFICLFVFAQLQARLARLHSPRCLFCTQLRLGRKRLKWMSRTTVPRKKRIGSEKNSSFYTESRWCWSREAFSQSQLFPEIHHHILKKVKRGLVMIYPRILSDLHLGACQPHLISWSGKGWPSRASSAQNRDCSDFLHFSQRLPAAGGWVGGASRKP